MTLEVVLLVGVATRVAAEAGRSLVGVANEAERPLHPLQPPLVPFPEVFDKRSCKDNTPPSSFSPKLSLKNERIFSKRTFNYSNCFYENFILTEL